MMEQFVAEFPELSFSCLPVMPPGVPQLRLGIVGNREAVDRGLARLLDLLSARKVVYTAGEVERVGGGGEK